METKINPKIEIESIDEKKESIAYNFFSKIDNTEVSNFNIIYFVVKPGQQSIKEHHKVKEYWLISKGQGRLSISEKTPVEVNVGELYFFDSMVSHQIENVSKSETLEIVSIWW